MWDNEGIRQEEDESGERHVLVNDGKFGVWEKRNRGGIGID